MSEADGRRPAFPHEHTYARIGRSTIHGVGVVAIRPIPKGTYVFGKDDQELRWIPVHQVLHWSRSVQRLYRDFCVRREGQYGCPRDFNRMTVSWYLNHSVTPNLACDESLEFFALREIDEGEELTVDYRTYSEVDEPWANEG